MPKKDARKDLLVWVDLEMTGLDPSRDQITEIAMVLTDTDLNVVAEGPNLTVKFADEGKIAEILKKRSAWDPEGAGEYVEAIRKSTTSLEEAERQTLVFLEAHVEKGASPLCGNSIHMDRYFLMAQMPRVIAHLHYRNIDVSTLKELARRWRPELYEEATKRKVGKHRAKEDILESIEELRFYREHFLK